VRRGRREASGVEDLTEDPRHVAAVAHLPRVGLAHPRYRAGPELGRFRSDVSAETSCPQGEEAALRLCDEDGRSIVADMKEDRRAQCWSAVRFALLWSIPVYMVVGSFFIVVNEQVLSKHIFAARRIAEGAALLALLVAAAWSETHDRTRERRCR
jgi:hypothetical protein